MSESRCKDDSCLVVRRQRTNGISQPGSSNQDFHQRRDEMLERR